MSKVTPVYSTTTMNDNNIILFPKMTMTNTSNNDNS